jgi:hypothetical protein
MDNIALTKIVAIVCIFVLLIESILMKYIRTEAIINASGKAVWKVLIDFNAYPEWNSFVHIIGRPGLGQMLEVTMYLEEDGKPQSFRPKVIQWEVNRGFTWKGGLFIPGIFDGEHFFELNMLDDDHVKFIHGENFSGILSGIIMRLIGKKAKLAYERMNSELKRRVEAMS